MLPADFNYVLFAGLLAFNGIGMGLMAAPNSAAIMNAVPASERGAASGIRATGMNAGMVLSMGGFFTLMAVGLASTLPAALSGGLIGAGVAPGAAHAASHASPVGLLFAAFLGDNPVHALVPNPGAHANTSMIYGQEFFPHLISEPFRHGLLIAFSASIIMLLLAAGASLMRGAKFVHAEAEHPLADGAAREGGALSVPALPDEDVAYDDALAGRSSA
jgi:hypothetical protein